MRPRRLNKQRQVPGLGRGQRACRGLDHAPRIGLAVGALLVVSAATLSAAPLEAEKCAQLKADRDVLAATGATELVRQKPPERRSDLPVESVKQVRALITLDGQLRFRCGINLLLPTLKPDPVDEFVDAGDTAGGGRPSPRPPAVKRVKAPPRPQTDQAQTAAPVASAPTALSKTPPTAGTPVTPAPRTAAIKTGTTPEQSEPATKPSPKLRSKSDDAYRAPAAGDPNAKPLDKPLDKQLPKLP